MAVVIRMPKMSDTMTEGVIASWNKRVGDKVKSGDILAEVETDKATMELESYDDGVLLHIGINEKESVPVNGVIAIIGKEGEDIQSLLKEVSGGLDIAASGGSQATAPAETVAAATPTPLVAAPVAPAEKVNATAVRMPKMSDTMTEGTIVAWHKKVGDKVKSGELLAEVETDKATMEMESYEDGTLLYIGIETGNAVKVDEIIAIIGEAGANYQVLLNAPEATTSSTTAPMVAPVDETVATPAAAPAPLVNGFNGHANDGRQKVSPLAKQLAKEKGVDLNQVQGTGDYGRIVKRDIENFKPAAITASTAGLAITPATSFAIGEESFTETTISQMRKTIARRLSESKFTAPHFYLTMEINMDKATEARKAINEYAQSKVSFNDMIVKASAAALKKHPAVNSSWLGDKIRTNHHVHIGVAVAVEEGLLVPVVRFADAKSLTSLSAEIKDLGAKAKSKQLQPKDWEGNTFTISNLGMFGIEEFTAIINTPDAAILAVGAIKDKLVLDNGQVKNTSVMKVTLSCDHRVVDGAVGSAFLQTLKQYLENPVLLLA